MHHIRNNLAVCGFPCIGCQEEFEAHGFTTQLQCAEPFDPWLQECIDVKALPFADGEPIPKALFDSAMEWLVRHWGSGSKILISCAGGQSRSVTMAIALLCTKSQLEFMDAMCDVMSCVPEAYPHPNVLVSAAKYCGETLQLDKLRDVYANVPNPPPYPWSIDLIRNAIS